jgi:hypothetical protein
LNNEDFNKFFLSGDASTLRLKLYLTIMSTGKNNVLICSLVHLLIGKYEAQANGVENILKMKTERDAQPNRGNTLKLYLMKTLNALLVIICLSFSNILVFGQEQLKTESETHIFWQENRPLKAEDFQGKGPSNPKHIKYCEEYQLCTVACLGLFGVVDVPKKKRMRGKLLEKAYFVPAFEKACSYILKKDSLGLEKQQLTFDIYELCARYARKDLKQWCDTMKGYGTTYIMFKSVESKANRFCKLLIDSLTKEIYTHKKDGAYEKWRHMIDKNLDKDREFATKPEDCYRFVKNSPIDNNYILSKTLAGDMWSK